MAPRPTLESAEELAGMFAPEEFGEPVIVLRPDGSQVQIIGIFDREHVEVSVDAEASISSSGPQVLCQESDLEPFDGEDFRLSIRGVEYVVNEPQPRGNGLTLLLLHLA